MQTPPTDFDEAGIVQFAKAAQSTFRTLREFIAWLDTNPRQMRSRRAARRRRKREGKR